MHVKTSRCQHGKFKNTENYNTCCPRFCSILNLNDNIFFPCFVFCFCFVGSFKNKSKINNAVTNKIYWWIVLFFISYFYFWFFLLLTGMEQRENENFKLIRIHFRKKRKTGGRCDQNSIECNVTLTNINSSPE